MLCCVIAHSKLLKFEARKHHFLQSERRIYSSNFGLWTVKHGHHQHGHASFASGGCDIKYINSLGTWIELI
jgi:hypothetical protein